MLCKDKEKRRHVWYIEQVRFDIASHLSMKTSLVQGIDTTRVIAQYTIQPQQWCEVVCGFGKHQCNNITSNATELAQLACYSGPQAAPLSSSLSSFSNMGIGVNFRGSEPCKYCYFITKRHSQRRDLHIDLLQKQSIKSFGQTPWQATKH